MNKQANLDFKDVARGLDIDAMKRALALGADINTPVSVASVVQNGSIVNINDTALHFATSIDAFTLSPRMDVVDFLLKNGAIVDVRNSRGETALFYAVINKNIECIKVLLQEGADIENKNDDGLTPLLRLLESGILWNQYYSTIKLLLNSGADITSKYQGNSAMDFAITNKNFPLVTLILDTVKERGFKKSEMKSIAMSLRIGDREEYICLIRNFINDRADSLRFEEDEKIKNKKRQLSNFRKNVVSGRLMR